jgi:hypothetical protein
MIANGYTLLSLLLSLLELAAGGVLLVTALRGMAAGNRTPDGGFDWERHRQGTLLLVALLATLTTASLVVWVLLLVSYVPQWEGLQCVAGVLRIGTGSEGATGWLPTLARGAGALRLAGLFGAGAAVVLHLASRGRPEGPLPTRHLVALALLSVVVFAGAVVESAYLLIPKQGSYLAAGCCTTTGAIGTELRTALPPGTALRLTALFALPALALSGVLVRGPAAGRWGRLTSGIVRVFGAVLIAAFGLIYVGDVVAPAHLGLPLHRCTYCLVEEAPEMLVGVALILTPLMACGWRAVAGWASEPPALRLEVALDRLALFGALGALAFFLVESLA